MRILASYDLNKEIAEKWSQKVTDNDRDDIPEGLFGKSADEIAEWFHRNRDSLKSASSAISFYYNREKQSDADKKKAAAIHKKLRELFGK